MEYRQRRPTNHDVSYCYDGSTVFSLEGSTGASKPTDAIDITPVDSGPNDGTDYLHDNLEQNSETPLQTTAADHNINDDNPPTPKDTITCDTGDQSPADEIKTPEHDENVESPSSNEIRQCIVTTLGTNRTGQPIKDNLTSGDLSPISGKRSPIGEQRTKLGIESVYRDVVDGLPPSASKSRSLSTLPSIEEGNEDDSESSQLQCTIPSASSSLSSLSSSANLYFGHGVQGVSSKPTLTSISEECRGSSGDVLEQVTNEMTKEDTKGEIENTQSLKVCPISVKEADLGDDTDVVNDKEGALSFTEFKKGHGDISKDDLCLKMIEKPTEYPGGEGGLKLFDTKDSFDMIQPPEIIVGVVIHELIDQIPAREDGQEGMAVDAVELKDETENNEHDKSNVGQECGEGNMGVLVNKNVEDPEKETHDQAEMPMKMEGCYDLEEDTVDPMIKLMSVNEQKESDDIPKEHNNDTKDDKPIAHENKCPSLSESTALSSDDETDICDTKNDEQCPTEDIIVHQSDIAMNDHHYFGCDARHASNQDECAMPKTDSTDEIDHLSQDGGDEDKKPTNFGKVKGSGSDSRVNESTSSICNANSARESHSEHTISSSTSDKQDKEGNEKDSQKQREKDKDREGNKRKRDRVAEEGSAQVDLKGCLKNAVGDVYHKLSSNKSVASRPYASEIMGSEPKATCRLQSQISDTANDSQSGGNQNDRLIQHLSETSHNSFQESDSISDSSKPNKRRKRPKGNRKKKRTSGDLTPKSNACHSPAPASHETDADTLDICDSSNGADSSLSDDRVSPVASEHVAQNVHLTNSHEKSSPNKMGISSTMPDDMVKNNQIEQNSKLTSADHVKEKSFEGANPRGNEAPSEHDTENESLFETAVSGFGQEQDLFITAEDISASRAVSNYQEMSTGVDVETTHEDNDIVGDGNALHDSALDVRANNSLSQDNEEEENTEKAEHDESSDASLAVNNCENLTSQQESDEPENNVLDEREDNFYGGEKQCVFEDDNPLISEEDGQCACVEAEVDILEDLNCDKNRISGGNEQVINEKIVCGDNEHSIFGGTEKQIITNALGGDEQNICGNNDQCLYNGESGRSDDEQNAYVEDDQKVCTESEQNVCGDDIETVSCENEQGVYEHIVNCKQTVFGDDENEIRDEGTCDNEPDVCGDDVQNVCTYVEQNVTCDNEKDVRGDDDQKVTCKDEENVCVDNDENITVDDENDVCSSDEHNMYVGNEHNLDCKDARNTCAVEQNGNVDDEQIVCNEKKVCVNDGQNSTCDEQNGFVNGEQNVCVDDEDKSTCADEHYAHDDDKQNVWDNEHIKQNNNDEQNGFVNDEQNELADDDQSDEQNGIYDNRHNGFVNDEIKGFDNSEQNGFVNHEQNEAQKGFATDGAVNEVQDGSINDEQNGPADEQNGFVDDDQKGFVVDEENEEKGGLATDENNVDVSGEDSILVKDEQNMYADDGHNATCADRQQVHDDDKENVCDGEPSMCDDKELSVNGEQIVCVNDEKGEFIDNDQKEFANDEQNEVQNGFIIDEQTVLVNDEQNGLGENEQNVCADDGHNAECAHEEHVPDDDKQKVSVDEHSMHECKEQNFNDEQGRFVDDEQSGLVNDDQKAFGNDEQNCDQNEFVNIEHNGFVNHDQNEEQNGFVNGEQNISVNDDQNEFCYDEQNVCVDDEHNVTRAHEQTLADGDQQNVYCEEQLMCNDNEQDINDERNGFVNEKENTLTDNEQNGLADDTQHDFVNGEQNVCVDDQHDVTRAHEPGVASDDKENVCCEEQHVCDDNEQNINDEHIGFVNGEDNMLINDEQNGLADDKLNGIVNDEKNGLDKDETNEFVDDELNGFGNDEQNACVVDGHSATSADNDDKQIVCSDNSMCDDDEQNVNDEINGFVTDEQNGILDNDQNGFVNEKQNELINDEQNGLTDNKHAFVDNEHDIFANHENNDAQIRCADNEQKGFGSYEQNGVVNDEQNEFVDHEQNGIVTDEQNRIVPDEQSGFVKDGQNGFVNHEQYELGDGEQQEFVNEEIHGSVDNKINEFINDKQNGLVTDGQYGVVNDELNDVVDDEQNGFVTDGDHVSLKEEQNVLCNYEDNGFVNDEKNEFVDDEQRWFATDEQNGVVADELNGVVNDAQNEFVNHEQQGCGNDEQHEFVNEEIHGFVNNEMNDCVDVEQNELVNDGQNVAEDNEQNECVDDEQNGFVTNEENVFINDEQNNLSDREYNGFVYDEQNGFVNQKQNEEHTGFIDDKQNGFVTDGEHGFINNEQNGFVDDEQNEYFDHEHNAFANDEPKATVTDEHNGFINDEEHGSVNGENNGCVNHEQIDARNGFVNDEQNVSADNEQNGFVNDAQSEVVIHEQCMVGNDEQPEFVNAEINEFINDEINGFVENEHNIIATDEQDGLANDGQNGIDNDKQNVREEEEQDMICNDDGQNVCDVDEHNVCDDDKQNVPSDHETYVSAHDKYVSACKTEYINNVSLHEIKGCEEMEDAACTDNGGNGRMENDCDFCEEMKVNGSSVRDEKKALDYIDNEGNVCAENRRNEYEDNGHSVYVEEESNVFEEDADKTCINSEGNACERNKDNANEENDENVCAGSEESVCVEYRSNVCEGNEDNTSAEQEVDYRTKFKLGDHVCGENTGTEINVDGEKIENLYPKNAEYEENICLDNTEIENNLGIEKEVENYGWIENRENQMEGNICVDNQEKEVHVAREAEENESDFCVENVDIIHCENTADSANGDDACIDNNETKENELARGYGENVNDDFQQDCTDNMEEEGQDLLCGSNEDTMLGNPYLCEEGKDSKCDKILDDENRENIKGDASVKEQNNAYEVEEPYAPDNIQDSACIEHTGETQYSEREEAIATDSPSENHEKQTEEMPGDLLGEANERIAFEENGEIKIETDCEGSNTDEIRNINIGGMYDAIFGKFERNNMVYEEHQHACIGADIDKENETEAANSMVEIQGDDADDKDLLTKDLYCKGQRDPPDHEEKSCEEESMDAGVTKEDSIDEQDSKLSEKEEDLSDQIELENGYHTAQSNAQVNGWKEDTCISDERTQFEEKFSNAGVHKEDRNAEESEANDQEDNPGGHMKIDNGYHITESNEHINGWKEAICIRDEQTQIEEESSHTRVNKQDSNADDSEASEKEDDPSDYTKTDNGYRSVESDVPENGWKEATSMGDEGTQACNQEKDKKEKYLDRSLTIQNECGGDQWNDELVPLLQNEEGDEDDVIGSTVIEDAAWEGVESAFKLSEIGQENFEDLSKLTKETITDQDCGVVNSENGTNVENQSPQIEVMVQRDNVLETDSSVEHMAIEKDWGLNESVDGDGCAYSEVAMLSDIPASDVIHDAKLDVEEKINCEITNVEDNTQALGSNESVEEGEVFFAQTSDNVGVQNIGNIELVHEESECSGQPPQNETNVIECEEQEEYMINSSPPCQYFSSLIIRDAKTSNVKSNNESKATTTDTRVQMEYKNHDLQLTSEPIENILQKSDCREEFNSYRPRAFDQENTPLHSDSKDGCVLDGSASNDDVSKSNEKMHHDMADPILDQPIYCRKDELAPLVRIYPSIIAEANGPGSYCDDGPEKEQKAVTLSDSGCGEYMTDCTPPVPRPRTCPKEIEAVEISETLAYCPVDYRRQDHSKDQKGYTDKDSPFLETSLHEGADGIVIDKNEDDTCVRTKADECEWVDDKTNDIIQEFNDDASHEIHLIPNVIILDNKPVEELGICLPDEYGVSISSLGEDVCFENDCGDATTSFQGPGGNICDDNEEKPQSKLTKDNDISTSLEAESVSIPDNETKQNLLLSKPEEMPTESTIEPTTSTLDSQVESVEHETSSECAEESHLDWTSASTKVSIPDGTSMNSGEEPGAAVLVPNVDLLENGDERLKDKNGEIPSLSAEEKPEEILELIDEALSGHAGSADPEVDGEELVHDDGDTRLSSEVSLKTDGQNYTAASDQGPEESEVPEDSEPREEVLPMMSEGHQLPDSVAQEPCPNFSSQTELHRADIDELTQKDLTDTTRRKELEKDIIPTKGETVKKTDGPSTAKKKPLWRKVVARLQHPRFYKRATAKHRKRQQTEEASIPSQQCTNDDSQEKLELTQDDTADDGWKTLDRDSSISWSSKKKSGQNKASATKHDWRRFRNLRRMRRNAEMVPEKLPVMRRPSGTRNVQSLYIGPHTSYDSMQDDFLGGSQSRKSVDGGKTRKRRSDLLLHHHIKEVELTTEQNTFSETNDVFEVCCDKEKAEVSVLADSLANKETPPVRLLMKPLMTGMNAQNQKPFEEKEGPLNVEPQATEVPKTRTSKRLNCAVM